MNPIAAVKSLPIVALGFYAVFRAWQAPPAKRGQNEDRLTPTTLPSFIRGEVARVQKDVRWWYAYIKLESTANSYWIVLPPDSITVGQRVAFHVTGHQEAFEAENGSLAFDRILFGTLTEINAGT